MEVIYDLDTEAKQVAAEQDVDFVRAATVGTHPAFVAMLRELVLERVRQSDERLAIGTMAAGWDVCPPGCCRLPQMPKRPAINDVEAV
jgi:ferrochelatase